MTSKFPEHLKAVEQKRKSGDESFCGSGLQAGFSLIEFWRWGSSDLVGNATRGRLAEFLVAKALGLADGMRTEWDVYDLLMPSGLKVEVKSCAYLQSWPQVKESPISFGVPLTRALIEGTNKYEEVPLRQADVYVFALLAHREKATLDPMDLEQWHFYVLPTAKLNERGAASISLKVIQELGHGALRWDELAGEIARYEETVAS